MAQALVQRLLSRFGGQKIYIPSETAQSAKRRGTEIREQFTGNNLSELASNHRLSKRQVRNILTQADKAKADRPKQKTRP